MRRFIAMVNALTVLISLFVVFVGVNFAQMPNGLASFLAMRVTVKNLLLTLIFLTGGAVSSRHFGLTALTPKGTLREELIRVIKASTVTACLALIFPLTSHTGAFRTQVFLYFLPTAIAATLCGRVVARTCARKLMAVWNNRRDVLIVGTGPRAVSLYRRLQGSAEANCRILGFVDSPGDYSVPQVIRERVIGRLEELEDLLMWNPVDEVLIALPAKSCYEQIQTAIRTCEHAGIEAKYLSDVFETSIATPCFESEENTPVVRMKVVHDDARLLVKRAVDIAAALTGLILLGPLMLLIALAVRLTSPGPAIFTQERYGFRKRCFRMYKFRSMVSDAEKLQADLETRNEVNGPAFKIRNDPRITPLGRILRKTSLDELPQFLNVLKGDMSLVGPRPLPLRDVSRFDDASLMRRFSVKPGLTCLWQLNGRSDTDFGQWIALDLRYIDEWSLGLDAAILARTIPVVIRGKGAV